MSQVDRKPGDGQEIDTQVMTVYWRPGCMFCSNLLRRIDKAGLPHRRVNIWDEPEAAETVRSHANGNETVPTVSIGKRWFVNPSLRDLKKAYAEFSSGG